MYSSNWKRRRGFFPFLLCLLAGFLCSCSLFGGARNDEQALRHAADRFNTGLRWEDYKSVAAYIPSAGREAFWEQADRLQGRVRIMDIQVQDVGITGNGSSGNVTLRYRFFHKRNPQLQTTTLNQQWLFSDRDRGWQVVRNDLEKLMP
jgi:hypothetical protein